MERGNAGERNGRRRSDTYLGGWREWEWGHISVFTLEKKKYAIAVFTTHFVSNKDK